MLWVMTLSGFLPSLSSSSVVWAKAGPHHNPATDASSQIFFTVILPWFDKFLHASRMEAMMASDFSEFRAAPRQGNEGPDDDPRFRGNLRCMPCNRQHAAGRDRALAGAVCHAAGGAEPRARRGRLRKLSRHRDGRHQWAQRGALGSDDR